MPNVCAILIDTNCVCVRCIDLNFYLEWSFSWNCFIPVTLCRNNGSRSTLFIINLYLFF